MRPLIRAATPNDIDAITQVVRAAFEHAEHRDGTEHELVGKLRADSAFMPELSLVAEVEGTVVGHILFTRAQVGDATVLALAPLSVLPAHQRQGIGRALIEAGHARARELGDGYSVVLGSEAYYPRFGYRPADEMGIRPPFDVPRENFMALRLRDDAPTVQGVLRYARAFGL